MSDALIIDACRTPRGIGKPGKGALAHLHPQRLAASVLAAIAERNDLDTSKVDDIIWGTSNQSGTQAGDLGRMAALDAGYDVKASGVTLDRFCGSGITSSNLAAGMIGSGLEDIVIAGGTDMMSTYAANRVPGLPPFMDAGNTHLRSIHPQPHQGICGDAIATLEGIPREALDDLAFESQQRAARAIDEGRFERSLITVHNDDGTVALDHDEYPRPQTTREGLSGAGARVRRPVRRPARRGGHVVQVADHAGVPRPRGRARPPRRQQLRRRRRRGGHPVGQPRSGEGQRLDAAGPRSWRWPTSATARP